MHTPADSVQLPAVQPCADRPGPNVDLGQQPGAAVLGVDLLGCRPNPCGAA